MDKNKSYNIVNNFKPCVVIIHGICGFEEYLQKQKKIQKEKEKEKGLTYDDNVFGNICK